ncbi:MAG: NYN domain-containing protein [Betaproteobacteria bacterium]
MDRVAVFVDAGYLFAQGSILLAGKKLTRSEIGFDHEKAIAAFAEFATKASGLPLLRVYWYDGTSTGPSSQHITLAFLPGVKVRLGFVNSVGEQKGVDSLIVTDMITLARNRAMAEVVLLSGDEDLRVGVQQAQEYGVRVHLLGISPCRGNQSLFLLQEADVTYEWGKSELQPFLSSKEFAPSASSAVSVSLGAILKASTASATGTLADVATAALLGHDLDVGQKKQVRSAFLSACEKRLPGV